MRRTPAISMAGLCALGAIAVLGITSLPPGQAGAAGLLAYLRGHWAIEMHHYVRDVAFGEDGHRAAAAHQAFADTLGLRRQGADARA